MEPSQIGRDEVLSILRKVGDLCPRRIPVYLIGGGAMALRGEKDSTRDLDLVLESQGEADVLKRAFERIGFTVDARRPNECRALVDAAILSKPAGDIQRNSWNSFTRSGCFFSTAFRMAYVDIFSTPTSLSVAMTLLKVSSLSVTSFSLAIQFL